MKLLKTVNVVQLGNGVITAILAFPDTKEGNKGAELLFNDIVRLDSDLSPSEIEDVLSDGVYSNGEYENMYSVELVHSEKEI